MIKTLNLECLRYYEHPVYDYHGPHYCLQLGRAVIGCNTPTEVSLATDLKWVRHDTGWWRAWIPMYQTVASEYGEYLPRWVEEAQKFEEPGALFFVVRGDSYGLAFLPHVINGISTEGLKIVPIIKRMMMKPIDVLNELYPKS